MNIYEEDATVRDEVVLHISVGCLPVNLQTLSFVGIYVRTCLNLKDKRRGIDSVKPTSEPNLQCSLNVI